MSSPTKRAILIGGTHPAGKAPAIWESGTVERFRTPIGSRVGEEEMVLRVEPEIGRILEQARDRRGLSLEQVEQATKIRARYLEELERGNFGVLPAVYAKGSLRTYADYLGLDAEALIRELEDQRAFHPAQDPTDDEPPKGSPGIPPIPRGIPAGAGGRRKVGDEEEAGQTPIPAGGDRRP